MSFQISDHAYLYYITSRFLLVASDSLKKCVDRANIYSPTSPLLVYYLSWPYDHGRGDDPRPQSGLAQTLSGHSSHWVSRVEYHHSGVLTVRSKLQRYGWETKITNINARAGAETKWQKIGMSFVKAFSWKKILVFSSKFCWRILKHLINEMLPLDQIMAWHRKIIA